MYDDIETGASHSFLKELASLLKRPVCLIGGWAVYYNVNKRFEKQRGRPYLGSRDIDLGFDSAASFKQAGSALEKRGFSFLRFRYYKSIDRETGRDLTADEEKGLPMFQMVRVWVDPFVPRSDAGVEKVLGFHPLDEPLLEQVFSSPGNHTELFDGRLWLPAPRILLATKLNCLPGRDKHDKRIKDLCDITALCLFTSGDMDSLIGEAKGLARKTKLSRLRDAITDEDVQASAGILGFDAAVVRGVVERILRR